jgi:hypothetical protein
MVGLCVGGWTVEPCSTPRWVPAVQMQMQRSRCWCLLLSLGSEHTDRPTQPTSFPFFRCCCSSMQASAGCTCLSVQRLQQLLRCERCQWSLNYSRRAKFNCRLRMDTAAGTSPKAVSSSFKIPKILQDSSSHRIFGHMYGALNIDKK